MQAQDIMTRRVVTVEEGTAIDAVARLMVEHRISAVPVVDAGGAVVGIVSEGDLVRRLEGDDRSGRSWWLELLESSAERADRFVRDHGRRAADAMSRDVVACAGTTPIAEIAHLLETHGIKRVPVIDDGQLVGIVSRADLLRAFAARGAEPLPGAADDRALRERLAARLKAARLDYHPYVNIVAADGVLHLWGLVESRSEAEALRLAAEEVAGEGKAQSHLRVRAVIPAI
jgi:CBS domain-containing protein